MKHPNLTGKAVTIIHTAIAMNHGDQWQSICYDNLTDKYNLGEIIHTEQRNN